MDYTHNYNYYVSCVLLLLGNETQLFLFNIVMKRELYYTCGKLEVHTKFVFESLEGRDYFGQLYVDGRAESNGFWRNSEVDCFQLG
jgi:hypothetical protein